MPYEMIVTVRKDDLLKKLRENKEKHHGVFLDALDGYGKAAVALLEKQLADLRDGRKPREVRVLLSRPDDHTADYERVIAMLEMHQGDEFDLDEQMFSEYVLDEWSWRRSWTISNSGYSRSVAAAYGNPE